MNGVDLVSYNEIIRGFEDLQSVKKRMTELMAEEEVEVVWTKDQIDHQSVIQMVPVVWEKESVNEVEMETFKVSV
tara:strand:+ start:347 stop:571 length:225 start_codon:yes stop_codon:yes gene_type:complete